MAQNMNMETYKQKVKECLIKVHHYTDDGANKLMKQYEDDFQELYDWDLDPQTASGFLASGLY